MAVIPDIDVSTRKIEVSPSLHHPSPVGGEALHMLASNVSSAGNALDRIWEVQRRERERAKAEAERQAEKQRIETERAARAHEVSVNRDAEYLNNQCENYLANSLVGHMETDPATGEQKEVKGKWSKSYAELESEKTSLPKLTEEAVREMREEQWYKDASPEVRAAAERKFVFTRDRWMRKSVEEHARLKQADAVEKMKKNVEFNLNGAAATFGSKQEVVDPRTGANVPTYQYAAVRAGLKNFGALQGTEIENPEILDNPTARFEDLKWNRKLTDEQLAEKRDQFNDCVYQIYVNRIGALQKAGASGLSLGEYSPSECLDEADKMTSALHGMKRGRKAADGSDIPVVNDEQFNAIKAETEKARKKLDAIRVEANKDEYNGCIVQVGEIELDLCNPKKVVQTGNGLNYEAYCADIAAKHPNLSQEQSIALRKQYRQLCDYYDKYTADLAKHTKKVADAENKQKSEYGWFKENGSFVPSSAFPKDSDSTSMKEFNEEAAIWQNPKTAMARLEAARMTGRLSEADYKRYYSYGTMMMDTDAKKWWFKNYGKFNIAGLTSTDYGETDVGKDIRKSRERGNYSAASGIFAANRGVAKTYKNAADFVADTLEQDSGKNNGNESLVPIETLPKVYDTIRRFARAGVDPADAVRAILQPALQQGISRNLTERLSDPDYFNAVVEDFKVNGTHFTDTSIEQSAAGVGTNWYKDRKQAVTSDLVRQGRLKVGK